MKNKTAKLAKPHGFICSKKGCKTKRIARYATMADAEAAQREHAATHGGA